RSLPGDVRLRNDADAAVPLIHDGYPADLMLFHRRHHLVNRRVGVDRHRRLRHARLGRIGDRILALSHDATHDIAVGDNADHRIAYVDYRGFTAIALRHELLHFIESGRWRAARRIGG